MIFIFKFSFTILVTISDKSNGSLILLLKYFFYILIVKDRLITILTTGLEPVILKETDFKSVVSTNFTK
jgi:hypothetical protein